MTKWTETEQIPVLKKELLTHGISESSVMTLAKKGVVEIFSGEVSRLELQGDETDQMKSFSEPQFTAYDEITKTFETKDITLLHGVTGSGKTEIYVKLIQEALDRGEQVLYLLPEIALTTQLINRLKVYFGDLVGVYHSRFNQNERIEIWNRILENNPTQFRVILGARSSVFFTISKFGFNYCG